MSNRLTTRTVTFSKPFLLDEVNRELPAVSYQVETEEETLDGVSFLAYRRVSTSILVRPGPEATGTQMWSIHPDSLASALERDRETAPVG